MDHISDACARIVNLLQNERDWIAAMATVVCELHHTHAHFHWTGFYRVTEPNMLKIGPYQGTHGCIEIPFDKGVCGACARSLKTQIVPDISLRQDHIACSSSTQSEVVVPVITPDGALIAVLDVDSNNPDAFSTNDVEMLEEICDMLGSRYRDQEL